MIKAQEATRLSEIKEIEEFAKISYINKQMEEVTEGTNATMAEVISDLKEKGYKIKQTTGGENSITGIALSEENVTVERNTEKEITYTLIYSEGTVVRYFVEVQGKDYEILFNNGNITVNVEETNIGEISKEPEVIVESSNNSIIEAIKTEEGKIILTAKNELGDVEITIKEKNSNVTKKILATTRIPVINLTISQEEATIEVEEILNLTVQLEPSNTTDEIVWSSSNMNIATVSNNGLITGISKGKAIITVTCGDQSKSCEVTVNPITPKIGETGTTHTAKTIDFTWEELAEIAKAISNNTTKVTKNTAEVAVSLGTKSGKIGVGDTKILTYNNKNYRVRILGFNHDNLVNNKVYNNEDGKTNTKAGISFEFVDIITEMSHGSNQIAWLNSSIRTYLNNSSFSNLVNQIKIKQVKKAYGTTTYGTELSYCNDYLWLLSDYEMTGSTTTVKAPEGEIYKFYLLNKNNNTIYIKYKDSKNVSYNTRSIFYVADRMAYVNMNGIKQRRIWYKFLWSRTRFLLIDSRCWMQRYKYKS